ncbi:MULTISPECIES: ParB family protein [Enterobacter cloacae complex]|uniref:ParB family protein n=1 Tax=Enterobacter cloacae complex TaxID=354276 RepID=UPI001495515B|nr:MULTISPECIES: ParB family protein [Enterobacter cloacae complex]MEB6621604.1 ParB family protein [Enterobacter roggenkampii]MEB6647334.1 ParB family protein [Enterobacter kobei]HBQ8114664.1 ParB family protein [Klebsiella pneumoniae]
MSRKSSDVGAAMLQPGRQSQAAGNISVMPAAEMPMVLTLDQLSPNPDNPRTSRNPRYDDIKASIRSRGLDTVPKVTRDPDGEPDMYIFSDGGNTRYQILSELWQETGEDRFFRVHVLFKPWPGRLQCVIGHLAENEVRGELSFIEKAQGIHKARSIYEEQLGKPVSLRQLSELLTREGLPVHNSTISRMEDALKYLFPWIPDLLESGLGRPQITALLALRHDAERVWDEFSLLSDVSEKSFSDVFGQCCGRFNSPELWSLEMFRDELIGDLLHALPHPELDYDRWMMELDPKERNRRHHFGDPEPVSIPPANSLVTADSVGQATPAQKSVEVAQPFSSPRREISGEPVTPAPDNTPPEKLDNQPPRHEVQPDMYGAAPVISGESGDVSGLVTLSDGYGEENGGEEDNGEDGLLSLLTPEPEVVLQDDAPVTNGSIWHVPAHQDDIEHLQNTAFRLAWELGEVLGCEDEILPQRDNDMSAGYVGAGEVCSEAAAFLLGLTGEAPALHPAAGVCGLPELFTGGPGEGEAPALTDEDALKLLRLMRVMRRLRELQRGLTYGEDNSDE